MINEKRRADYSACRFSLASLSNKKKYCHFPIVRFSVADAMNLSTAAS